MMKKVLSLAFASLMVMSLAACGSSGGSDAGSDGKLTMQIWDNSQREAMQALADASMSRIPM